jgi:hypothetical protein
MPPSALIWPVRPIASVYVRQPGAVTLDLAASPVDLAGSEPASALVVTMRDQWGDPVANQTGRSGVNDDRGAKGTLNGSEVMTATTNAQGQLILRQITSEPP